MSERNTTPEVLPRYNTWEEFDIYASALLKARRDLIPAKANLKRANRERQGLLYVSHAAPSADSKEVYTYRTKENHDGFYVHVKNSTIPTPRSGKLIRQVKNVDIVQAIGTKFTDTDIKDYTFKFVRGNLSLPDQSSKVFIILNAEYEFRNEADCNGQKITSLDVDDAIEQVEAIGPLPVWHASADFGERFIQHLKLALDV